MGSALAAALLLSANWSALEPFQQTVSRARFDHLLATVYSPSGAFTNHLAYADGSVAIRSATNTLFVLRFAPPEIQPPASAPLIRRIALDPGHIGGDWARFEERHFACGNDKPIEEAALNLTVARLLQQRLEKARLTVFLTKNNLQPVTDQRPPIARADIVARARKINDEIKPDLTLCIHFNATAGKDLVNDNRLGVFIHGNYLPTELADDEQKFHLLAKLLERSHSVELAVAESIANALARATRLEPLPPSENAVPAGENPYVLLRNLAANRLYRGPVVYLEPYYMNNRVVYQRLQLGDYDGVKKIGHQLYRSIFREYADAVADGLLSFLETAPKGGQTGSRK